MRATRDFQVYQPVLMDEYLEEGAHCGSADFCPMECTNYGIVDLPDDAENIDADFTGVIRIDRSGIVLEVSVEWGASQEDNSGGV